MKRLVHALALGVALAVPAGAQASGEQPPLPPDSLYHLEARLQDQHGQSLEWHGLRGQPQLVSMFYGHCRMTCPLILESAKSLQKQLPEADSDRLGVAMLTLDPGRDTPAALLELAGRHRAPADWRFLRPRPDDVRALSSLLGVSYRVRADGSINHTSVLVLLDAEGREVARAEVAGAAPDPGFTDTVRQVLADTDRPIPTAPRSRRSLP